MVFSSGWGSGRGTPLAAWRPMLGQRHSLLLGFGDAAVSDQPAGIALNLDLVLGLAHLHATADPVHRDRVAVGVERDIAFHVHQAVMQPVDFGNPGRQRFQLQPLDRKQLAGHGADMFFVSRVDLIAPLPRLLIEILPTGEGAPGQEVSLDKAEGPFYARRTIRIPNRMRHELKTETLSKGGHLRHRHHVASAAAQHHHVRVIDHDTGGGATQVTQRLGEKHLAVEALKGGVALEEQRPRITQHRRCGLHFAFPAAQFEFVWGRVMLHLLAGREIILARGHRRRLPDSMPPAKRGQCGV